MKKLFKALLLVAFFITYSAVKSNAQSVINNTDCDFRIAVAYADPFCGDTGYEEVLVAANSVEPLSIPAGSRIVASKGHPVPFISPGGVLGSCVYYIGRPNCVPYPTSNTVSCIGSPCNNYTASLDASFANITIQ